MLLNNKIETREKLAIFNGETNIFEVLYHIDDKKYEVVAILDSSKIKQSYRVNNIPILPVESIKEMEVSSVFISSVQHQESIYSQIAKFNIKDLKVFYNLKMLDSNISLKFIDYDKNKLLNKKISIINNQCFGALLYKKLDLPYSSPFCWMYMDNLDFIKLLENLEYYLSCTLTFKNDFEHNFPVGQLDDINIYFNHYKSQKYAKQKWEERVKRFNWDNFFVVMRLHQSEQLPSIVDRFSKLNIKNKLIITSGDFENKECLSLKYWKIISPQCEHFGEYFNTTTFYNFDFIEWFNTCSYTLKS